VRTHSLDRVPRVRCSNPVSVDHGAVTYLVLEVGPKGVETLMSQRLLYLPFAVAPGDLGTGVSRYSSVRMEAMVFAGR